MRYNEWSPGYDKTVTERKVRMNGNEAGVSSPSTVHWKKMAVFLVLLFAFGILKTKVAYLEERTGPDRVGSDQIQAAGPVAGEEQEVTSPRVSDFMIDSGAKAVMVNLTSMEKSARRYYPIILKASKKHKVDPHLITAIIVAESGFNPRAVSRVGAKGLMQLMPRTARAMGLKDAFNPEKNIDAGVKYFRKLLDRFGGNTKLALAAYNAGIARVDAHGGIPPYRQTTRFVKKVSRLHKAFKQSEEEQVSES